MCLSLFARTAINKAELPTITIMRDKLYLVFPNRSESGTVETLPETKGMHLIKDNDIKADDFVFHVEDKVCIASEASLEIVKEKLSDSSKKRAIEYLKDKHKFREILSEIYPDYQYKRITFSEIETLQVNKRTVLKPLKGCFGTAVKILDQNSDLKQIAQEVKKEIDSNSSVLSESVLSNNDFILEDYILGDEYAIDMFFDENGEPNIVNIYYHPMPKVKAYMHMLYYTSKEVFDKVYDSAIDFFRKLNQVLQVKNFVMHGEFKFQEELFPIEINAMRYGGMGLGNMIYHSIGLNPYEHFKNGTSPDWSTIWGKYGEDKFAFMIAYNGTDVDVQTQEPDLEKLRNDFTEILREQIFDYKSQLAFGIFCIKENTENIQKLLEIDFNDYFKDIEL